MDEDSPLYQHILQGVLHLHRHDLRGTAESEEAVAIRTAMAGLWEQLTPGEKERLAGLSCTLHAIAEGRRKRQEGETVERQA